ncbi:MAG: GTPase HflX [Rubrobacter sp.]|nr:GTPase HflX [Rubrobacter sp.]
MSRVVGRVVLAGAGDVRHMGELRRLSETLGLEVCGEIEQARRDPSAYLGGGKRAELNEMVSALGAGFVVADDELTASEARVLERDAGVAVVDRTELIIRIFEAHARDAPSKLQVELAEMEYLLPRVRGMWRHLERLGGGLGSSGGAAVRGPGEQQLEYDRREIRARMEKLRSRLAGERSARGVRRARLREAGIPKAALVGYTNAGKTTILNRLSNAGRSTKDRLFETLETTTRRVEGSSRDGVAGASGGKHGFAPDFTLTDTVGFIRKLPTQLVESFASTLEAASDADLLILCADASSPHLDEEVETVKETLSESGSLSGKPIIPALNKADLISVPESARLSARYGGSVLTSALGGEGFGPLLDRIYEEISAMRERMEVLIPHSSYEDAARLYGMAEIHASEDRVDGVLMDVSLPASFAPSYSRYKVGL